MLKKLVFLRWLVQFFSLPESNKPTLRQLFFSLAYP